LTAIAAAALTFYRDNFPLFGSIFAEPAIFDVHRLRLRQLGAGPHKVNDALAGYLSAEQRLGRVDAGADLAAAADLLLGACFQQAFLSHFQGRRPGPALAARYASRLLRILHGGPDTESPI